MCVCSLETSRTQRNPVDVILKVLLHPKQIRLIRLAFVCIDPACIKDVISTRVSTGRYLGGGGDRSIPFAGGRKDRSTTPKAKALNWGERGK